MAIKILDAKGNVLFDDPNATSGEAEYVFADKEAELFIDYKKGNEASVTYNLYFYDKEIDKWFSLNYNNDNNSINDNNTNNTITASTTEVRIIDTVASAEKIKIEVVLNGSTTSSGSVEISVKPRNKKW